MKLQAWQALVMDVGVIAESHFRRAEVNEVSDEALGRSSSPQRYVRGEQQRSGLSSFQHSGIVLGSRSRRSLYPLNQRRPVACNGHESSELSAIQLPYLRG